MFIPREDRIEIAGVQANAPDELDDPVSLLEQFERTGWTVTESGCWEWNGSRTWGRGGYGQLNQKGLVLKAHRVSYELYKGPVGDAWVLHNCDNPPCVRPDHLYLGDVRDNVRDMRSRNRGFDIPPQRGEASPSAKLTAEQVVEIRVALAEGAGLTELGRKYGVTKQAIYRIKKGLTWTP